MRLPNLRPTNPRANAIMTAQLMTNNRLKNITYNTRDSLVVTDLTTSLAPYRFISGRADGIPSSPVGMVVCDKLRCNVVTKWGSAQVEMVVKWLSSSCVQSPMSPTANQLPTAFQDLEIGPDPAPPSASFRNEAALCSTGTRMPHGRQTASTNRQCGPSQVAVQTDLVSSEVLPGTRERSTVPHCLPAID